MEARMNGHELERRLEEILGEVEEDQYSEWWSEYTGANGFFHTLSGETGYDTTTRTVDELVERRDDGLYLQGLGLFKKVEVYDANFDTYEGRCDTYLVFEFQVNTYRVKGWFDSHRGGVWDSSIEEVKPVEKTITVWERS
jgi:hypothetical protein